jgi:hypothetical protein
LRNALAISSDSHAKNEIENSMRGRQHAGHIQRLDYVVRRWLGAPNEDMSRAPEDIRFGNHESVSVNYTTGQWYDSENERGGGVKELIHVFKEIEDRDAAIAYAEALRYFLGKFR